MSPGNARFSIDSPLSRLTKKQAQVLTTAYNLGYYDIPRRTNSDELAAKLKMQNPTFVMHRRRAERKIIQATFDPVGGSSQNQIILAIDSFLERQ